MKSILFLSFLLNIDFVVENKIPPKFVVENKANPEDPFLYTDYAKFHNHIKSGGYGVLVIGLKDRFIGAQFAHCRVDKGFGKLDDGDYECFLYNGQPAMVKIIDPALKPTPNPFEVCPPSG